MISPSVIPFRTLVVAAVVGLGACASPTQLGRMQEDLSALRTEMAALSARFDRLDKQLRPPEPPRVNISFAGRPVLGDSAAKVGIVEFSDFQCPYCQRFQTAVQPLLKERYIDTGKVQMVFRDFPLEFHPLAKPAAVAVNCAGAQGHYWDMVDAVFHDQERLGADLYRELAGRFGLDIAAFEACQQDPAQQASIQASVGEGAALGIEGTPTFLIGRIEGDRLVDALTVVGAQPFPALAQVIESFLDTPVPAKTAPAAH